MRDELPAEDKRFRPLYLYKEYDESERQLTKLMLKKSYYKSSGKDQKWRKQVPVQWRIQDFSQRKTNQLEYTTVMEIPNTQDSLLLKDFTCREPKLARLTKFQIKYVEQSGIKLASLFQRKISAKRCDRPDCIVCTVHASNMLKGKSG